MSNKLKKKITCVFCEKTVPYTSDCQELFGRDVCMSRMCGENRASRE